jgi:ABC-type thiamine transport system substrate-binding protein
VASTAHPAAKTSALLCLNGLCLHLSAAVVALVLWRFSPGTQSPTVVVYVSHDQVFSEPILKDFEKETGIKVRAVYDTEETKSTGAMNRLIAEKNNPQADVYWANEPVRAEVLRQQGIAAPYTSPNAEGRSREPIERRNFFLSRLGLPLIFFR